MGDKPIEYFPRKESLSGFKKRHKVNQLIDNYSDFLEELFYIRNPIYRFRKEESYGDLKNFLTEQSQNGSFNGRGRWFYFPWNKNLVHFLDNDLHQELRTARNKNLITGSEQKRFYNFNVGVAGLSVGSHAALTIVMMGGAKRIKLSDFDDISGSNLNRIRTGYCQIGMNKSDIVARQVYEMNPYSEVFNFNKGLSISNLDKFLAGPPKLDVLIECMDNPELKIAIRLRARNYGIPVLMATDNGDSIIFDIERFDRNKKLKLFSGVIGDITPEKFRKFAPEKLPAVATKIAGQDFVVPRMLKSVSEVGKTLYSWPQLGDAATFSGVVSAYVVRKLSLGQKLKSGKMEINLDSFFDPDYFSRIAIKKRLVERKSLLKKIGL